MSAFEFTCPISVNISYPTTVKELPDEVKEFLSSGKDFKPERTILTKSPTDKDVDASILQEIIDQEDTFEEISEGWNNLSKASRITLDMMEKRVKALGLKMPIGPNTRTESYQSAKHLFGGDPRFITYSDVLTLLSFIQEVGKKLVMLEQS